MWRRAASHRPNDVGTIAGDHIDIEDVLHGLRQREAVQVPVVLVALTEARSDLRVRDLEGTPPLPSPKACSSCLEVTGVLWGAGVVSARAGRAQERQPEAATLPGRPQTPTLAILHVQGRLLQLWDSGLEVASRCWICPKGNP